MSDKHAALRASQLLRDFTDVGVRILAEACEQRSVGRETFAWRAGEPSAALAFVARGSLQLLGRDGGAPIAIVGAGDSLGSLSLLTPGEHLLSVMAATDSELLILQREAFESLQETHPRAALKLTLALARDLAERLREAQGPLREFLVWQISKRQTEGR